MNSLPLMPIEKHEIKRGSANSENDYRRKSRNNPRRSRCWKENTVQIKRDREQPVSESRPPKRNCAPIFVNDLQVRQTLSESLAISNIAIQNREIRKGQKEADQPPPRP